MTNIISSFVQAIPPAVSIAPVVSGEAAALAFGAIVDMAAPHAVIATPPTGKSDAPPADGAEDVVLAQDMASVDEASAMLIADIGFQMVVPGLAVPLVIPPKGDTAGPLLTPVQNTGDAIPPMLSADLPSTAPQVRGTNDQVQVAFDADPMAGLPVDEAGPKGAFEPPVGDSVQAIAGLRKDLHGMQESKVAPDLPATAPKAVNMPETPHPQPIQPVISNLPVRPDEQNVQVPDHMSKVERALAAVVNAAKGLVSAGISAPLAAVVMRPTSDTALLGFQMRLRDAAETPAIDDGPTALAAPAARPAGQAGVPDIALNLVAESRVALSESDVATATPDGADPFGEVTQQAVPFVPTHRSDPAPVYIAGPVSLRDMPQAVAAALHADPAQPVSLQLDPIELGTVAFNMETGPAGLVVTIIAERPETLELMRRHADQFLADLRQSGFQGASLNFGQSGGSGHDHHAQDHPPARAATPFSTNVPQFEAPPRNPQPRTGSGLDMRL